MACFVVPAAEAIVVTAAAIAIRAKEKKSEAQTFEYKAANGKIEERVKVSFSRKLGWLSSLLWGGCILLAFEHIWHGEITAWFPYLTAASSPESMAVMLSEMSSVGVIMSVLVTAVWLGMVGVCAVLERKMAHSRLEAHA